MPVYEVARDVWQLTGFPRHYVNCYRVGDVLIDAGTRWARRRLLRQLGRRPVRLPEVLEAFIARLASDPAYPPP